MDAACNVHVVQALYTRVMLQSLRPVLYVSSTLYAGLEISACPLAKASVKTVGRVQIKVHSPGLASTISYP